MKEIKIKEVTFGAVLLLLAVGLFLQYNTIGMYFDDFGNASLSYGRDSSAIHGTDYSVYDLIAWAKHTYFHWGGRILYALIMIPMMKHSVRPFMLFQAGIVFLIFAVMYKIAKRYCGFKCEPWVLIGFAVLYGSLNGSTLTHGIYWASASVLYVLPLLPFFLCIELYNKGKDAVNNGQQIPRYIYGCLALFIPFVTLSQEQIGGGFLVWIIARIILGKVKGEKGNLFFDAFVLLWSIITFLVLFLAPGNWVRLASNTGFADLPLLEKIKINFPILVGWGLTNHDVTGINCLLFLSGIAMLVMLYRKKRVKKMLLIVMGIGICPFGIWLLRNVIGRIAYVPDMPNFRIFSYCLFLADMFFIMLLFFYQQDAVDFVSIMLAGVASVFCLLISPTIAMRSCIPYIFICMLLIMNVSYWFYKEIEGKLGKYLVIFLACACVLLSIKNLVTVYSGYRENKVVDEHNWKVWSEYNGSDTQLKLWKYTNNEYRAPAPYDEGFEFCAVWVKEYFDIPQNVQFVWVEKE